jgi:hypothetical protein
VALPLLFAQMGMQLFGTLVGRQSELEAGTANARELNRQALLEDANAVDALQQGAQRAGLARMAGTALAAKQRMAYAASGVDATVGTPAQVQASTALLSEYNAQLAKNDAVRAAFRFRESARAKRLQAQDVINKLGNGWTEAVGMGSTLVGGVSKALGQG